eukprot:m51a1_g5711 hypothetical protein (922) ;mRNA; f:1083938-1086911
MATLAELCMGHVWQAVTEDPDVLRAMPVDLAERVVCHMLARLRLDPARSPASSATQQRISLRVHVADRGRVLTARVNLYWTVREALADIHAKACETDPSLGRVDEYGLFLPGGQSGAGKWMRESMLMMDYDLRPLEELRLEMRQALLKVKFHGPWEKVVHPLRLSTLNHSTLKAFKVDASAAVKDTALCIASKLALPHPEEFGLKVCLCSDDRVRASRWLDRELTLAEQRVDPMYAVMLLRRQTFNSTSALYDLGSTPEALHLSFCQCLDAVISGIWPCTPQQAVQFAALQSQTCLGNYSPSHADIWRVADFLPPEHAESEEIVAEAVSRWADLNGLDEEQAKIAYVSAVNTLPSRNHTFFSVQSASLQPRKLLLGVSQSGITLMHGATKDVLERLPFAAIRKWETLASRFTLFLSGVPELEFYSSEADCISQVLALCVHHNLRGMPDAQRLWDGDCDDALKACAVGSVALTRRISVDSTSAMDCDPHSGELFHKCRLYREPKKQYYNPLFDEIREEGAATVAAEMKRRRLLKLVKILAQLSRKMPERAHMKRHTAGKRHGSGGNSLRLHGSVRVRRATRRNLVVKLANQKSLTVPLYDSCTVLEAAMTVAEQLGITAGADEWSLMDAKAGRWLRPHKTLREEVFSKEASSEADVLFRKKFHWCETDDSDTPQCNLQFSQLRYEITQNAFLCSTEEAVQLAATLFQSSFGDHNPLIHKPGFLQPGDMKFFMAQEHVAAAGGFIRLERMIYKEHSTLRGLTAIMAKYRFVQLCRSLPTYGTTFFPIKGIVKKKSHVRSQSQGQGQSQASVLHPEGSEATQVLLGFARSTIGVMDPGTREFLQVFPVWHLRKWCSSTASKRITLDFGDYREGTVTLLCADDVRQIADYIEDYADFLQRKNLCRTIRRYNGFDDNSLWLPNLKD